MKSKLEKLFTDTSELAFFRELSFTGQQLHLPDGSTEELADLFVWMDTEGILFQVKERQEGASAGEGDLRKWFEKKVLSKGSDQIAASRALLQKHSSLNALNCRGMEFELGELNSMLIHNVIIYGTLEESVQLPESMRFHRSSRSGVIHLIQADDFANLLHWLGTPGEMIEYLRFREAHLCEFDEANNRTEQWMFASFVDWSRSGEPPRLLEIAEADTLLASLEDDAVDVNLRDFIDFIGDWAAERPDNRREFPKLIVECAHLNRAAFREFKIRLKKCLSRLDIPAPKTLYRIHNEARDCLFVFGVLPSDSKDNPEIGAANYTYILKYERRAGKAVGFFFTPIDDEHTGTSPVYLERPWEHDLDAESAIETLRDYFRPLDRIAKTGYKSEGN